VIVAALGRVALAALALYAVSPLELSAQEPIPIEDLRQMSIDELASMAVTSVSRRAEPLLAAPAAIYVITAEDIRRSGVTSLPEALRLAPNLQVTRMDALGYAISARGFNATDASNKLLVLIDGRTVYSPLHSGVFWDAQNVMLADVERIEVVSGPGGTLWGANAVNGVINIITRPVSDVRGGYVSVNVGNVDRDVNLRYGVRASDALAFRLYLEGFERGNSLNVDGTDHADEWNRYQGGFGAEWNGSSDAFAVRAERYESHVTGVEDLVPDLNSEISGHHVLGWWRHTFADGSLLRVQAYYDATYRDQKPVLEEDVATWDLELEHSFGLGDVHRIVWGAGFRNIDDRFENLGAFVVANPESGRTLGSVFLQDELAVSDALSLTTGIKVEKHTYTDFEYMPNARLAWRPSETTLWWAAVSRAVRTPSRIDRELELPGVLIPSPDAVSEKLVAYEAGYRAQPATDVVVSVSAFLNDYGDLRTTELSPGQTLPAFLSHGLEGFTYGVELSGRVGITDWWRLSGGVTAFEKDLELDPGVIDISNLAAAGNDPSHQLSLRSLMNPLPRLDLDVGVREVGELSTPEVPGYVELDARVAWHLLDGLEISAAAFNLLHESHPEGGAADTRHEIRRSFSAGLSWSF
jgi:iron complex outermembrane receptor protein